MNDGELPEHLNIDTVAEMAAIVCINRWSGGVA
jgi:hypothetical protein